MLDFKLPEKRTDYPKIIESLKRMISIFPQKTIKEFYNRSSELIKLLNSFDLNKFLLFYSNLIKILELK